METISTLTIEHIVIASNQPYEKVLEALKTHMGSIEDWKEMTRKLGFIDLTSTSWEQIVQIIETHLGTSLMLRGSAM
jgi:D-mannonate dehydratase